MSVEKEIYIVFGCKFDEDFTEEYWKKDFRDDWEFDGDSDEPRFLTDGMSGNYTFFGFIKQVSNGDWDDDVQEIDLSNMDDKKIEIIESFNQLYPGTTPPHIKLYFVPHYT